jgi:hypothetical protein
MRDEMNNGKPFTDVLGELENGQLLEELTEAVYNITHAVRETRKKGSSGPLPEVMTLGIPVYFRGTAYAVPVLVRYRLGSGAVQFQLKMDRADIIEDAAFGELTARIGAATGIAPYLGRV